MLCHLRAFIRLLSFTLIMTAMSIAVPLARVLGGVRRAVGEEPSPGGGEDVKEGGNLLWGGVGYLGG